MRRNLLLPLAMTLSVLSHFAVPLATEGATIWTGPPVTFFKVGTADPSQPTHQDRITPNVWLTRGLSQGIYNAKTETFFTHFSSPADTAWADGTTANVCSLSYTNWNTWAKIVHGGPPNTVGVNAVVHLIAIAGRLEINLTLADFDRLSRSTP